MREPREFLTGLLTGLTATFAVGAGLVYALAKASLVDLNGSAVSHPEHFLSWAYSNLGSSIPVFVGLLAAFFLTLSRLRSHLDQDCPIDRVVQLDHLTDIWTTLFFGTGVIWTAIGMRSALIFALGDRSAALSEGAFAMLERMIDGGILLALSTTIVGGIGGYLMRVYKTITVGARLQRCYDRAARADTSEMRQSLERIERHIGERSESQP